MNRKQIVVLSIGIVAIVTGFLFPTWASLEFVDANQGQILMTNYDKRLFNNPPKYSDLKEPYVEWRYAIHEAVAYAATAGTLCYLLRTRKARVIDNSHKKVSTAAAF